MSYVFVLSLFLPKFSHWRQVEPYKVGNSCKASQNASFLFPPVWHVVAQPNRVHRTCSGENRAKTFVINGTAGRQQMLWTAEFLIPTKVVKSKLCGKYLTSATLEPEYLGRYSDWAAGWTVRGSNSVEVQEIFIFYETSRPTLGPIQPPVRGAPGFFLEGKAAGSWRWQLTLCYSWD